ncbi:hypothetical protein K2173_007665 [Erythroxylum novogranatense]|uniref:Uncharacterized protein n=1 Tax=Erythroxylum novogranatense TaxID=1862640 RepID=A0AAV8TUA3_9ROSI|nr:hypothetical protein K2173_007665 [Erythroxylum novogranatense]
MGVKVAVSTRFQWSQPILPHSTAAYQSLTCSAVSSFSSCCRSGGVYLQRPSLLLRTCSFEHPKSRARHWRGVGRACSASLDAFSDEEFSEKIQELALRFQVSDQDTSNALDSKSEMLCEDSSDSDGAFSCSSIRGESSRRFHLDYVVQPPWIDLHQDPTDDIVIPASIERKANSVELPLSLRIIKRKMQWQEGFIEAGESAYCSVKKAFSSMVFIIRELHSFTLQMREVLLTEDLKDILVRVHNEMHASFVWLFQQVFSHTPTLMVYVMILLANFTVYSVGRNAAIAATPHGSHAARAEIVSAVEIQDQKSPKFDSSTAKTFLVSGSSDKSASVGGFNGGGGKVRPLAGGTEGDWWFVGSDEFRTIDLDGASHLSSLGTKREAESVSGQVSEEELTKWNSLLEEASLMLASMRDESLDQETMQRLVSPITATIESDDYEDYFRTELLYQTGLSQEPGNPLLLANYAQFLYLVGHDYDRAEDYFKSAVGVETRDAEAYNKYATFLWRIRKDLWAAEETFLEAIASDPSNTYHAANYAHFLWNTGGEDTCFPLSSPDTAQEV